MTFVETIIALTTSSLPAFKIPLPVSLKGLLSNEGRNTSSGKEFYLSTVLQRKVPSTFLEKYKNKMVYDKFKNGDYLCRRT